MTKAKAEISVHAARFLLMKDPTKLTYLNFGGTAKEKYLRVEVVDAVSPKSVMPIPFELAMKDWNDICLLAYTQDIVFEIKWSSSSNFGELYLYFYLMRHPDAMTGIMDAIFRKYMVDLGGVNRYIKDKDNNEDGISTDTDAAIFNLQLRVSKLEQEMKDRDGVYLDKFNELEAMVDPMSEKVRARSDANLARIENEMNKTEAETQLDPETESSKSGSIRVRG